MSTNQAETGRQRSAIPELLNCSHCGKEFKPKTFNHIKYCSNECRSVTSARLMLSKRVEAKRTGLYNGRPYSEYYYEQLKKKSIKRRADLLWLLDYDYFMEALWNKPCYYCGSHIQSVGIDRIDSLKSYEIGNVVPCCHVCNSMKMALSQSVFIEQCKKIANKLGCSFEPK